MKLKDLGEFNLIDRIRQQATNRDGVLRSIGDDAAVLSLPKGHTLLTSTDMLIEGIHFRHDWTSPEDLGRKAVAVNLSDIAAMGGTPRYLYIGLACDPETDVEKINRLMTGILAEASEYDVSLVGGDTCRSPGPWIISVTIEGSIEQGKDIGRDGASPGDLVMVTGTLGDSALAFHKLSAGNEVPEALASRHHKPRARVEFGSQLGAQKLASSMIDISDGLAADLEHILQASRVDAIIVEDQIPRSELFRQHVKQGSELEGQVFFGGEDYELLFTIAPENAIRAKELGAKLGLQVSEIGAVQEGSGACRLQDRVGAIRPILVRGYDHFCRPQGSSEAL